MLRSLFRRASPPLLALALALAAGARDARAARFDEKGNDLDAVQALNAEVREAAARQEKERLERMRRYALAIRLDEPEETCLARFNRTRACALSVGEFNEAASRWFPAADSLPSAVDPVEADSIRKRLLLALLQDPYLDAQVSRSGSGDSLEALLARAEADRVKGLRVHPGDSVLRALYRKHSRLFEARTESTYEILGSSDSAYVDSLGQSLADPRAPPAGAEPLPWRILPWNSVPSQARARLASLRPEDAPLTWKSPFGHFLVRLRSRHAIPAVPYAEAVPLLGALQMQPKGLDARQEELIVAYYAKNRSILTVPDTLLLKAWLKPGFKRKRGDFLRDVELLIRRKLPVGDTMDASPLRLPDSVLPAEARAWVASHPLLAQDAFLGPLPSVFGTWYFRVLEVRRGKRPLTLEEARGRIAEILFPGQDRDPLEMARSYLQGKRNSLRDGVLSSALEERFRPGPEERPSPEGSAAGDSPVGEDRDPSASERASQARDVWVEAETRRRRDVDMAAWIRRELSVRFIGL